MMERLKGPATKNLLQILALIALTLYVVAKDVIAPQVSRQSPNAQVQIIERLARLEECTRKIETVPEKVAALTEATSSLKVSVDRLEKKLDDHVSRGK